MTTPRPRPVDVPVPADAAAFRAFVRANHPDRGGDPATFASVVSAYRAGGSGTPPRMAVQPGGGVRRRVRRGLRTAGTLPGRLRRAARRGGPRVR